MSIALDLHDSANPTLLGSGDRPRVVIGNNGRTNAPNEVYIGINMNLDPPKSREAWGAWDADELRDAIDKAVGPRNPDPLFAEQVSIYHQVAMHPAFDDCWTPDSAPSAKAMIEKLDGLTKGTPTSPVYPTKQRDRHLRHIEDIQATLTRRNERHEQDQERIRELEAEAFTLREIKDSYEERKTAREYLDLAWEAAIVPKDGLIHEDEEYLVRHANGDIGRSASVGRHLVSRHPDGSERRLLEPRVELTREEKRQALIDEHGLQDWEIELLRGAA